MFAVLVAFAGALVAAVGTGMLVGRCLRVPRLDLAAWSAAMALLAISLGAQTLGFGLGFSGGTFRAAELGALLLGPLWLAWGLVELTSDSMPARFGMRLATGALTIVPGVILALDPLSTKTLGKTWPGQTTYMSLPHYVLILVQVVATVTALVVMTLTAVRTRRDPELWDEFIAIASVGVAVLLLVSLRLSVPLDAAYPALTAASAGLVWFAVVRADLSPVSAQGRAGGARRRTPEPAGGSRPGRRRRTAAPEYEDDETGPLRALAARAGSRAGAGPGRRRADGRGGTRRRTGGAFADTGGEDWPGADRGRSGSRRLPDEPQLDAAKIARPGSASPLYGLISIYTLLDTRAGEFDRIAEETVHAVRMHEPDTLMYISHHVPNAPMQRIFYEVYRDRAAFEEHQRQPHSERFLAHRRSCVLATNVIELDLRHAKVSSLAAVAEGAAGVVADGTT
jgi:quinol monooxygenase YgiN